jgi:hypothetical protein
MRINSYNLSSYSGFVGIGAIGVPSGTTTNISLTVGAYTGLAFTVFSITKKLPINYVAATNTGVPTGASFTHSLTTSSPVTRKIVFSGISSYAGGATNATSSLDATYINSYGSYVFGSAYKNITSVNPFSLTWFAPADWSTLGHTVSSLAIGF